MRSVSMVGSLPRAVVRYALVGVRPRHDASRRVAAGRPGTRAAQLAPQGRLYLPNVYAQTPRPQVAATIRFAFDGSTARFTNGIAGRLPKTPHVDPPSVETKAPI